MLLSAIHAEGPIWKGHTSFNIAARASYFNWIMQPLLDKVYDNANALKPYSKMNYYDLNAKFVHKFSDRDKLTAVVYWGKDVSDASPSDSYKIYKGDDNDNSDYLLIKHSTINHWDNVMGSAYWTHLFNNSFSLNVNANISHYLYYLKLSSLERTEKEIKEDSYASFNSEINEASLSTDFRLKRSLNTTYDGALKVHTNGCFLKCTLTVHSARRSAMMKTTMTFSLPMMRLYSKIPTSMPSVATGLATSATSSLTSVSMARNMNLPSALTLWLLANKPNLL